MRRFQLAGSSDEAYSGGAMVAKMRPRSVSEEVQRGAVEREKETAAAAGREGGAALGFGGAVGALVVARGQVERGPRGGARRATPLPFGEAAVTKDRGGARLSAREERERAGAGELGQGAVKAGS